MDQIVFYDRYRKETRIELVYGDKYLRWTYGTLAGRIALATVVKRIWFSRWYGWRMDQAGSRKKIQPFIEKYGLDPAEFVQSPEQFENFNQFFYRQLKPSARPVDPDPEVAVFPAEGRHLCIPNLASHDGLFVKGEMFDLSELVQDAELASHFANGSLLLSRLCPVDYHRFHFPVAGRAGTSRLVNGPLYSVNPIALCQNIRILSRNKRALCVLESDVWGKVVMLEIGATCVGGIQQTYAAGSDVLKGAEKGYFRFGGSSTITLFEPGRIQFDDDLLENSAIHRELYARVGDRLGRLA